MLRSLYAGISGLRAHQAMLDVVGNNIANVNTTGFKSSSAQFEDTLSQLVSSAGRSQSGVGGVNPAQVGLGVKVAGVTTNFTQGSNQLTGKSTDMMIQGDGFFVTKGGDGQNNYTRNGSFGFDALGQLTSVDGNILQGWLPDAAGNINTNGAVNNLTIPSGILSTPKATSTLTLGGNLASNAPLQIATSGTPVAGSPMPDGSTAALTPTPGSMVGPVNQTVYDTLGKASTVQVTFTHTSSTTWQASYVAPGSPNVAGVATITMSAAGLPTTTSATFSGTPAYKLDLTNLSGYAGPTTTTSAGTSFPTSTVKVADQDGAAAGSITSFAVGADGTLTATFDNGLKKILGQVAVASFANPAGLTKSGNSSYAATVNSGTAQTGAGGTGGRGSLAAGSLEMSNVDLSQEFSNLIIAQRGFQANSRIITTSDQVLQTLTQMGG